MTVPAITVRLPSVIGEQATSPSRRSAQSFNCICQVAPMCTYISNTYFLDQPQLPSETAARSVQPFLHGRCHILTVVYTALHTQKLSFIVVGGNWTHPTHRSWAHPTHHPKRYLNRLGRFSTIHACSLYQRTDGPTDIQNENETPLARISYLRHI